MNKIILGLGVLAVVGVGVFAFNNHQEKKAMAEAESMAMEQKMLEEKAAMEKSELETDKMDDVMMKKDEMLDEKGDMMKESDQMKKDEMMMESEGDSMMKKMGEYIPYESSKLAMAKTGDVVLFFKASWCPSCRTLDSAIKANAADIPAGLTILEVDYDTAVEMKKKYGVTSQHTLVQVDESGNLITKWSGGSTLASVVEKVQ